MAGDFFGLLPETVLAAAERCGARTTGRVSAYGSLENRVYDVELEDGRRIVGKFYRPDRWSRDTILDEHRTLGALVEHEIVTCAPLPIEGGEGPGSTLGATPDGIWFALFPRIGGRSPDEIAPDDLGELGRLLGRIHNVAASLGLAHRPALSPATYGTDSLNALLRGRFLPAALEERYATAVRRLVAIGEERWRGVRVSPVHADCHRGNLLRGVDGRGKPAWIFLDFDDMAVGPAVQDLWLLLPARPTDCPEEVDAFIEGYETFRSFDRASLGLVEVLRGLRYVRYAAWVASRWQDPSFPRAFPDWGSERYWHEQLVDLHEQLEILGG
jgi:Ser/Thr protein kinase RdoA (MazF antagonist)